jgi:dinuclear metal center YbgI/SA1388 family protein
MMKVNEIIKVLENWYPPYLAEEGDPIGLQVGRKTAACRRILVALEVTAPVVKEAIKLKADLIVTHHPLLFRPIKKLTDSDPRYSLLESLMQHRIAVYSMHTNLDFSPDGTCFSLADEMGLQNIRPLIPLPQKLFYKIAVFVPESHLEKVSQAIFNAGGGVIGNYESCSFRLQGIGTFRGNDNTHPFIGKVGNLEAVEETRLEVLIPKVKIHSVIAALKTSHPYEEPAYDIYPLDNQHPQASIGVKGDLKNPVALDNFAQSLKRKMKIPWMKVVGKPQHKIKTVGVITGSGADFIPQAQANGCDILITGDLKYHIAQDALSQGFCVLDIGHYFSEAHFMPVLYKRLQDYAQATDGSFQCYLSKTGADPLRVI